MSRSHGHSGRPSSPTYNSWRAMIARCFHTARRDFKWYGARGIQVDPAWLRPPRGSGGFEVFLADLGLRPENTTLDRIDVNGHYEAANCRWATIAVQSTNRQPGGYATEDEAAELAYRESIGEYDPAEYHVKPKWPELVVIVQAVSKPDIPF